MTTDFVETTAEAAVGGYQGIKKVRGLLVDIKRTPPKFTNTDYGEPKDQIENVLEDASIIELFPNAEEFELKDGKLSVYVPYAAEGKTPHKNSIYMRCYVASAEELGKKPSQFKGEYVILERQDRLLFKTKGKNEETGEEETVEVRSVNKAGLPSSNSWCFVGDITGDSDAVKAEALKCIVGFNQAAALRNLVTNNVVKGFPEYKEALKNGSIGELLDVELGKDGKYAETA